MKSYRMITKEINELRKERDHIVGRAKENIKQVLRNSSKPMTASEIMAKVEPEYVMSPQSLYGLIRKNRWKWPDVIIGRKDIVKRFIEIDEFGNPLPNAPIQKVRREVTTYEIR